MFDPNALTPMPADAIDRTEFRNVAVPIARLADLLLDAGRKPDLNGVRFIDCAIRGPAVILPSVDTQFRDCNLGNVHGEIRNLFLRAAGPMVTGAIALHGCLFESCVFLGVGIAGDDAFVDGFVAQLSGAKGGAA
jgi:hypothetical protein